MREDDLTTEDYLAGEIPVIQQVEEKEVIPLGYYTGVFDGKTKYKDETIAKSAKATTGLSSKHAAIQHLKHTASAYLPVGKDKEDEAMEAWKRQLGSAMMFEFKPQDAAQGYLVSEIVETRGLSNTLKQLAGGLLLNNPSWVKQIDVITKLMKASARQSELLIRQLELLNKLQGGGTQQKMTVEHIHINAGANAIIGNVDGSKGKKG
jgi:hypothetical protein